MSESAATSARESILRAVRQALPPPAPMPNIPFSHEQKPLRGGLGYHGELTNLHEVKGFPQPGEPLLPYFRKHLAAMGGQSFLVSNHEDVQTKVTELFPDARVIRSTIAEVFRDRQVQTNIDPHVLEDVDVAILRSRLGVAEAGAIWLSDADLRVPALGVLAQHLVVVLDPSDIVPTLHEAYDGRLPMAEHAYGVFMAGPSATGDIEGVIVHGAQGARSMTVLLLSE